MHEQVCDVCVCDVCLQLKITMDAPVAVQVDGEPWVQQPGQVVVLRSALKVRASLGVTPLVYMLAGTCYRVIFVPA